MLKQIPSLIIWIISHAVTKSIMIQYQDLRNYKVTKTATQKTPSVPNTLSAAFRNNLREFSQPHVSPLMREVWGPGRGHEVHAAQRGCEGRLSQPHRNPKPRRTDASRPTSQWTLQVPHFRNLFPSFLPLPKLGDYTSTIAMYQRGRDKPQEFFPRSLLAWLPAVHCPRGK